MATLELSPSSFKARRTSASVDDQAALFDDLDFEVRFPSLFHDGRGMSFPCDREGHVDFDVLSDRAKANYLFARAMVGREFASPEVNMCPHAH